MTSAHCASCGVRTIHRHDACIVCGTEQPEFGQAKTERELEAEGQIPIFPDPSTQVVS